jgi:hypothetical protein
MTTMPGNEQHTILVASRRRFVMTTKDLMARLPAMDADLKDKIEGCVKMWGGAGFLYGAAKEAVQKGNAESEAAFVEDKVLGSMLPAGGPRPYIAQQLWEATDMLCNADRNAYTKMMQQAMINKEKDKLVAAANDGALKSELLPQFVSQLRSLLAKRAAATSTSATAMTYVSLQLIPRACSPPDHHSFVFLRCDSPIPLLTPPFLGRRRPSGPWTTCLRALP